MSDILVIPRVHLSQGNSKIGNTLNVSLPPGITCQANVPCAKRCYAKRIYKRLSSVKKIWDENYLAYRNSPEQYFDGIIQGIMHEGMRYFRWHVSGDIPDARYFQGMCDVARVVPTVQFLAYTRFPFEELGGIPENLTMIRSYWRGFDRVYNSEYPAFMAIDKGLGIEAASEYYQYGVKRIEFCPGKCPDCRSCWEAKPGDLLLIHIH